MATTITLIKFPQRIVEELNNLPTNLNISTFESLPSEVLRILCLGHLSIPDWVQLAITSKTLAAFFFNVDFFKFGWDTYCIARTFRSTRLIRGQREHLLDVSFLPLEIRPGGIWGSEEDPIPRTPSGELSRLSRPPPCSNATPPKIRDYLHWRSTYHTDHSAILQYLKIVRNHYLGNKSVDHRGRLLTKKMVWLMKKAWLLKIARFRWRQANAGFVTLKYRGASSQA